MKQNSHELREKDGKEVIQLCSSLEARDDLICDTSRNTLPLSYVATDLSAGHILRFLS